MLVKNFLKALLVIAAGLLACWVARADPIIVAVLGVPGPTNTGLPAMYSDHLASAEMAANNLYNLGRPAAAETAVGTFVLATEEIAGAGFSLPSNFSGAWLTSFSNLNLPPRVYWEMMSDPETPSQFHDWVAMLPPPIEDLLDIVAM
jgi:hypothetical protein